MCQNKFGQLYMPYTHFMEVEGADGHLAAQNCERNAQDSAGTQLEAPPGVGV